MTVHQYVQHEWSPALWAVLLSILAIMFVVGMGLFLWGAARPKQAHFSGAGDVKERTARS